MRLFSIKDITQKAQLDEVLIQINELVREEKERARRSTAKEILRKLEKKKEIGLVHINDIRKVCGSK